jgi:asparagine synthase (glutamine-hydrolysing)
MCGIAGVLSLEAGRRVPRGLGAAMCADLRHRGPDGAGDHEDPGGAVGLGHTRLAIIDLAGGRQPMSTPDGRLTIVFNGEIYNHERLRAARPHRAFRTRSDTEVILHVYDEDGLDGLTQLAGMFAFALWDAPRRRLVLARDRLGIKPLYWTVAGGLLAFASEIPPLLRVPGVRRTVDAGALRYFLTLRTVPAPLTLFRGIQKLAPAHQLVCEDGAVEPPRAYWSLATAPRPARTDLEDAARELHRRIDTAVGEHMLSDVPVGAFLSGGLDSSLIVACMRRRAPRDLHTFSVGAEAPAASELPYARSVSAYLGTHHHEHRLTPPDVLAVLPGLIERFADPVADPAAIPLYVLAAAIARHGLKVVLSGEGSDELFAGYPDYAERLAAQRGWRGAVWRLTGGLPPYFGHAAVAQSEMLRALLPHDEAVELPIVAEHAAAARAAGMDALQSMLFVDLVVRLPEDLLARTDRVTMAHGVEARVPFLDHTLVEHAFWLPSAVKVQGGVGKQVLKRAARADVPAEIVDRPKAGFPTPVRGWLSGPLRDVFGAWLLEGDEEPPCLAAATLARLVDEHLSGRRDWSLLLWRVWFFRVWHARWIAGRSLENGLLPSAARAQAPAARLASVMR